LLLSFDNFVIPVMKVSAGGPFTGSQAQIILLPLFIYQGERNRVADPDLDVNITLKFWSVIPDLNFTIPDPGSRSAPMNWQRMYFKPKNVSKVSEIWCEMFIPYLGSRVRIFLPDPGSGSATLILMKLQYFYFLFHENNFNLAALYNG
jgi:hypothetical protein